MIHFRHIIPLQDYRYEPKREALQIFRVVIPLPEPKDEIERWEGEGGR